MKRFVILAFFVYICYLIEYALADLFGKWFSPNLLIILVVFFNLSRGIRHSLIVALLAGFIKDCYSVQTFGVNIFAFALCAYLTTFIKMYIYQVGSNASRILMVFLISVLNVCVLYVLNLMFAALTFGQVFVHVLLPEAITTTIISLYIFERLKRCASRLFV